MEKMKPSARVQRDVESTLAEIQEGQPRYNYSPIEPIKPKFHKPTPSPAQPLERMHKNPNSGLAYPSISRGRKGPT